MAIQIERNENGNCVNFKGATQPVYWNNCLTAVAVGTDRINIQNDIRSAGAGQTYYEYFNVKIEDFCDNNGDSFANATAAANYINGVAKATPSGGIGPNDNINTTGIITAAQFSGDGSGLTGITATGSGVVIQEEGSNVGTAATLNFVGAAVTATISGGVATIGITGDGVGIGSTRADGEKLNWGDDNDLQIWHHSNGTGIIQNAGSGQLQLRSNEIRLLNAATDEDYAFFRDDGAVELYYDDVKRFETTGYGVTVTGIVSATSYYGDGSALTGITTSQIIGYSAGGGGGSYDNSDVDTHLNVSGASSGQILSWNGSDYAWVADQTGGGGGSGIGTQLADDVTLNFGNSDDLQIFHNGTASFIKDMGTGSLIIQGSNIRLQNNQASGTALQLYDGSAQLHYNNSKKLETTPDGVSITGFATVSSKVHVGGGTTFTEDLVVTGDARVTGILSIGTGTIVLDPNNDEILVGDVKLQRSASGTIEIRSKNNALKDIRARRIISNAVSEDDDGNVSITGVVTATTFVKTSGTSSQFLKADGSVDSTSYSTFDGNYNNLTNRPTIPTNNNQLTNGAGFITTSFVNTSQLNNDAGFITTSFTNTNQLTNGAGFITTSFTNTNQLTNGAGFITTSFTSYNQLSDTPTIPTNNNQLTNGAGFITSSGTAALSQGLTGTPNITVGDIVANNVSIAQTLTYEDVTNVDSVGLVTARTGIKVLSGGIDAVGVVTATSLVKSGGTSSQFLKADGSVDGTSYSTFSGDYDDLSNKPTIPTNNNQLTNGAGFITTSFTNTNQLTNGAGFITNSVSGDLTLTDTADDSSAGPEFVLYRNSSSPASSDYIGQIKFQGESDSGATRLYAKITGKIGDPTNGSEDGIIEIAHRKNGSNNISGRWNQDNLLLINGTGLSVNGQITAESNLDVTGNIIVSGNVDGRDVSADGTKLDGIETSADVTDATNVAAAGAVMESDTTTANMSFVVDEDNMASDSNTKVPTQQSVKAYVDANSGGGGTSTGKAIALSFIFG